MPDPTDDRTVADFLREVDPTVSVDDIVAEARTAAESHRNVLGECPEGHTDLHHLERVGSLLGCSKCGQALFIVSEGEPDV